MKTEEQIERKKIYDRDYNFNRRKYKAPKDIRKPKPKPPKPKPITEVSLLPKEGNGWYEKFMKLREMNILYFIKKIDTPTFVEKLHNLDENLLKEAERRMKRTGKRIRFFKVKENEKGVKI